MATVTLILVILLYVYGPRKEAIKWLMFTMSFAALYDLEHLIINLVLPVMQSYAWSDSPVYHALQKMLPSIKFLHQLITPYGFLMFSIVYSEMASPRTKNTMAIGLTFPLIIMCMLAIKKLNFELNYEVLLLWISPYYLTTCFLLIFAYWKEKDSKKKNLRLIAAFTVIQSTIENLVLDNLAMVFGFEVNEFGYLYISGAVGFVIFIILAVRSSVFGVEIKFEKQLLDQTIMGVASGTSMLNHALKNRITNIDLLAERIDETSQLLENEQIRGDVKYILAETRQMMQMVKRIQRQIEDVEIIKAPNNLTDIVKQALQSNHYLFESKGISVIMDDHVQFHILCDNVHLQEAFSNLLRNAVDAMEAVTGVLSIAIYENKKNILIDFTDNGKGVAKEVLHKIFDPFFSTKHKEDNFGLGLSYCYLVVRKHGGKIEVASKQNSGTTFTVHLPKNRVI